MQWTIRDFYPSQASASALTEGKRRMTLAKTLLAGAAFCALCTAPAVVLAAPHLHLAAAEDNISKVKPGSIHTKTNRAQPGITDVTYTLSLSSSLPPVKTPTLLWAYTWQDVNTCIPPKKESLKVPKKTKVAKISVGTSTGPTSACPSTTFTFYGPMYDLKKKAKGDSFSATLAAKKYSGYNYTAFVNTTLF
jgi:hypothetical protein